MANRFFPNYDTYRITSPFGMRTLRGATKMHNGIDLVADANGCGAVDEITAHTGGRVTASGYDPSAGYLVKLQTAPNVVMVYYHLREGSPLRVGDTVGTGQVIGHMGATGNVTGAHLHFGICKDGVWVDPAPYLDRDFSGEASAKRATLSLPVLHRGVKGQAVKTLQLLLNHRLDTDLDLDGSFGPATEAAVARFQREKGLEPDKRAGPATWTALLEVEA